MKKLILSLFFLPFFVINAAAQWQIPNNQIPVGKGPGKTGFGSIVTSGTGQCLVNNGSSPPTFQTCPFGTLTQNYIPVGNASNIAVGVPMSGDCTIVASGAITCTKTNGTSLGTMAIQNANNVAITGGTLNGAAVTGLANPVNPSDAANMAWVLAVTSDRHYHPAANVATTTTLPAYTYNNGASGVGATITCNSNGTVTVDGVALTAGMIVLVKNETSGNAPYNGEYDVTTAGDGSHACVLTRDTSMDTPAEIAGGDTVFIIAGTTNINTTWTNTSTVVTVGTTPITFVQTGGSTNNTWGISGSNIFNNNSGQVQVGATLTVATAIGIGTLSPGEQLAIAGATNVFGSFTSTGGIKTQIFSSDSNTVGGTGTVTNHDFTVSTNNTERLRVDKTGKFGNINSLSANLDFTGTIRFRSLLNGYAAFDGSGNMTSVTLSCIEAGATVPSDGSTDAATAIQTIFTTIQSAGKGCVRFPCGLYKLNSVPSAANAVITIYGGGAGCTRFMANNSSGAFSFTFDQTLSTNYAITLTDFDVVCASGGNCGTGIAITGSNTSSPPWVGEPQVYLRNIRVVSSTRDSTTEQWGRGIAVTNMFEIVAYGYGWYQVGNTTGIAFDIPNSTTNVTYGLYSKDAVMQGGCYGFHVTGGFEDVQIDGGEIVNSCYAGYFDGSSRAVATNPVLMIKGLHMAGGINALFVKAWNVVVLTGNDFFKYTGTTNGNIVVIQNSKFGQIIGNKFEFSGVTGFAGLNMDNIQDYTIGINNFTFEGPYGGITISSNVGQSSAIMISGNKLRTTSGSTDQAYFISGTDKVSFCGNMDIGWTTQFSGSSNTNLSTTCAGSTHY